jgi:hypothetical protein
LSTHLKAQGSDRQVSFANKPVLADLPMGGVSRNRHQLGLYFATGSERRYGIVSWRGRSTKRHGKLTIGAMAK